MGRSMIAALQVSLDGFTQGEDQSEPGWVDSWADALGLLRDVDAFVQGGGMYPGYADFWSAIEADPKAVAPYSDRVPYEREVAYARFAAKTPHYVLSSKLEGVSWPKTARVVRDVAAIRALKSERGGTIYVVGGPTLVQTLLREELIDELKLIVHPLLLGGGKALFAGGKRRKLSFVSAEPIAEGRLVITHRT